MRGYVEERGRKESRRDSCSLLTIGFRDLILRDPDGMELQVKRLTFGQRIGQSSPPAAEIANVWDTSSGRQRLQGMIQTDPGDTTFAARLAQINRTYPRIDLRPTRFASYLKEKVPGISWEPDLDVCLDFFLR